MIVTGDSGTVLENEGVDYLRSRVSGPVALPPEGAYQEQSGTFNLLTQMQPALVVGANSSDDVQATVRFAAERELPVAVLGSGHQLQDTSEGAVLINLSGMSEVAIEPELRRARVAGGARWGGVVPRAAEYGLAPVNGSSPTVGVVGYTLGGGQSPVLGRSYGYAADNVISLDIVTADGNLRSVSESTHPDLFWALRGGKSNFGVVTSMDFRLFPVSRFYGGSLFFSGAYSEDLLSAWRAWVATLPNEASSTIGFLRLPPAPGIPEPLQGTFVVALRFSSLGDPAAAEELLAPMRSIAPTVMDMVSERPYSTVAELHMDPPDPLPFVHGAMSLGEFPDDAARTLLDLIGPDSGTSLSQVEIRAFGGALEDEPLVPSAVAGRGASYALIVDATGQSPEIHNGQLGALTAALNPWANEELMANFLGAGQGTTAEEIHAFYGADRYERLARIKRKYDPQNVFRVNHNIVPAAAPS